MLDPHAPDPRMDDLAREETLDRLHGYAPAFEVDPFDYALRALARDFSLPLVKRDDEEAT